MMTFRSVSKAFRRISSFTIDWVVALRLGMTALDRPSTFPTAAVDIKRFWNATRVRNPYPVTRMFNARKTFSGHAIRFDIEGTSAGPGFHPGSLKFLGTVFRPVTFPEHPLPFVLLIHGFAVPVPYLEEQHARQLVNEGAIVATLELPFHMRRRVNGFLSGDGFFALDPERTVQSVRQSVEDAAAVIAWARQSFNIDTVNVMGFSLGGLIATLLATQIELDSVVAVAPFCDPAHTLTEKLPRNAKRRAGLVGETGGVWGISRAEAALLLKRAFNPIIPENHTEIATPPHRICLVAPYYDGIVGFEPIVRLSSVWGSELLSQPYGHMTIMSAQRLTKVMHAWLLQRHDRPDVIASRGTSRHIPSSASIHTMGRKGAAS